MSFWDILFGKEKKLGNTAQTAKNRLKVIVASEHSLSRRLSQDKIDQMKREIMQVVNRYMSGVDEDHINVKVHSDDKAEMLEMTINFPEEK
jgi:cell division topological specificity factor